MIPVRRIRGRSAFLLVLIAVTAIGRARPAAADETVDLQFFAWSVGALGSVVEGSAVLAVLEDGVWRAAIASERVSPDVLTAEFGEGWTVIGLAPDEAWWSPWRGPSESFAADAAQLLDGIVSSLSGDQATSWRHSLVRPLDLAAEDGSGMNDPAPRSGLSSRLAHRAAGRGGSEETWWCRSTPTPDGQVLRLRSRRRPGTFRIRPAGTRTILADPYEFLVPAWSIDELTIDGHSH